MKIGDPLHHDRFGAGTLTHLLGDRLTIQFMDGSERVFSFAIAQSHLRRVDRAAAPPPARKCVRKTARLHKLRLPRAVPVPTEPGVHHCNQCGFEWRPVKLNPKACRRCGSRAWREPKRDIVATRKTQGDERRMYWPSAKIDAQIRQAYADCYERNDRKAIQRCADAIKWPKFALTRRALDLGLTRIKESNWSDEELAVLRKLAHFTPDRISSHLKALGYPRSRTAVNLKVKRLGLRDHLDGYSAYKLSLAFGLDGHVIGRWIKQKLLQAELKGSVRKPQQGGDSCWIRHADVKAFVFAHPEEVDLRKVEKMWFLDLLTDGAIKA